MWSISVANVASGYDWPTWFWTLYNNEMCVYCGDNITVSMGNSSFQWYVTHENHTRSFEGTVLITELFEAPSYNTYKILQKKLISADRVMHVLYFHSFGLFYCTQELVFKFLFTYGICYLHGWKFSRLCQISVF